MWYRGHVNPFWSKNFKEFNFERADITKDQIDRWRKQGYTNQNFTSKTCNTTNTPVKWYDIVAGYIGLHSLSYVFYKTETCDIMPVVVDYFEQHCNKCQKQKKNIWNAVLFLDDWQSGHYFEIDGTPIVNYKEGDYVLWSTDTPYTISNIGITDLYTLQITGTRNTQDLDEKN